MTALNGTMQSPHGLRRAIEGLRSYSPLIEADTLVRFPLIVHAMFTTGDIPLQFSELFNECIAVDVLQPQKT